MVARRGATLKFTWCFLHVGASIGRRTWVKTADDPMVPSNHQARSIACFDIDRVVEIPAGHDMMISRPSELAEVLIDRCLREA